MNDALRDIRGLDPAPWWPPGPGWWLVAGLMVLAVALVVLYRRRRRLRGERWRRDALTRLRRLERRLPALPLNEAAGELSQLLRRVAMTRHGRRDCASLWGEEWLAWLEHHDPRGFPWRQRGTPLVTSAYAPPGGADGTALTDLAAAARDWIRHDTRQVPAGGAA